MAGLRMGIIGCGGIASAHAGNLLRSPDVQIVGLADPSPAAIRAMKEAHPELAEVPEFTEHTALLEKAEPDAVLIASPHTLHLRHILDAFEAGCHVECEKPFVTTMDEAREAVRKRDAAGKTLLVCYNRHYIPLYQHIIRTVRSGELGELHFVAGLLSEDWFIRNQTTWRTKPELSGGGFLIDSGSHTVDLILHAADQRAVSVNARAVRMGSTVDVAAAVTFELENGAIGTLSAVGHAPDGADTMWEDFGFYGSKGSLLLRSSGTRGFFQPVLLHKDFESGITQVDEFPPLTEEIYLSGPDANFIDAVMGRDEVHSTAEDAMRVTEFTEAAHRSMVSGAYERV